MQLELADLVEPQEVVEQVLQPRALPADHVDLGQGPPLAGRLRLGKILGQEVHVHADDRERILDLVGQRAGQRGQLGVLLAELVEGLLGRERLVVGHAAICSRDESREMLAG